MGDPHRKLARQKLKKHSRKAEEPSPSNRCNFVHVFIKMKNAFQLCVMMMMCDDEIGQKGVFDQNSSASQAACDTSIARVTGCVYPPS